MLAAYAAVATVLLVAVAAARPERRGRLAGPALRLTEIDVERINVRKPDGRLSLVVTNEDRMPGGIHGDREFAPHRPGTSGLVFYNGDGDEAGGLTWGSTRTETARTQFGHLSFDGVDQDQTLVLSYSEAWEDGERTERGGALRFVDRDVPGGIVRTAEEAERRRTGTAREQAEARRWIEENLRYGDTWSNRVVVGSIDGRAYLGLNDPRARERVRATVDAEGVARVEVLDGRGGVVRSVVVEP